LTQTIWRQRSGAGAAGAKGVPPMRPRERVPHNRELQQMESDRPNVNFAVTCNSANTAANQHLQVFTGATTPTLGWEVRMNRCKDTVNLGFRPASYVQIRCNPNDTSTKQNQQCNYDESKTDGNIQKPWQCEHFIAVYPHLQMELYRLIAPCVLSKGRGVGT